MALLKALCWALIFIIRITEYITQVTFQSQSRPSHNFSLKLSLPCQNLLISHAFKCYNKKKLKMYTFWPTPC